MLPPTPLAILCLLLFGTTALGLAAAIMGSGPHSGPVFAWGLAVDLCQTLALLGIWALRRWGVYLFLGSYAAGALSIPLLARPYPVAWLDILLMAAVPAACLALLLPNWRRFY